MAITRALFAGDDPTPDSVKKRMALAELLRQQGDDISHIDSPLEAIGSILQSGAAVYNDRKAQSDQKAGMSSRNAALASLLTGSGGSSSAMIGGGTPPGAGIDLGGSPAATPKAANIPAGERADYIRSGLKSRGLPDHVADAFLANFQDESRLDPGINEAKPLVPGSRGGFGLYQLTGPRRTNYEAFASSRGVNPSDIDAQLDFLGGELGLPGLGLEKQPWFGSEGRAAQRILGAQDAAGAAQSIVSDFLRPAEQHRAERAARYAGLGSQAPVQVASLDPSAGMGSAAPSPAPVAAPQAAQAPAQPTQNPQLAQMLIGGGGGAVPPQTQTSGVSDTTIAELLGNPWTEDIGQGLLQQKLQDNAANARLTRQYQIDQAKTADERRYDQAKIVDQRQYEQMTEAQKRAYEGQVRQEGYQRTDERNSYLDARQGSRDARADMESDRNFDRAVRADQKPNIITIFDEETGRERKGYLDSSNNFVPVGGVEAPKKSNGVVVRGPDGSLIQVGGDTPALTEGQSKDAVFTTRAKGALGTLDQYAPSLTGRVDRVRDVVPFGLARGGQSTEYQLAKQAGNEFLQAILRKDTGAAITSDEEALYGVTYLPQPGDTDELLAQKQQSRSRAVAAIEAGMPPAAIIAQEKALQRSSAGANMKPITAGVPQTQAPDKNDPEMVPEGIDPEDWNMLTPEERKLWR